MFDNIRQLLYPGKYFLPPEPKTNPSCFYSRDIHGCLNGLHTPKTVTARPECCIYLCATRPIISNRDALLCDITRGMSRNNDTQRLKKNTRHTWALNRRRPWTYSLCISRCRFRTPYDRPRPHKGAKPVSLFVSYGPRGPSGGPAPDAPLPLLPPLPLPPERLLEPPPPPPLPAAPVFSFLVAFLAGASPAAATLVSVPPSADPPPVAPRRLVPLPAARAEPKCVNTQAAPNRHVPFLGG